MRLPRKLLPDAKEIPEWREGKEKIPQPRISEPFPRALPE
jgi:hypothetical protein